VLSLFGCLVTRLRVWRSAKNLPMIHRMTLISSEESLKNSYYRFNGMMVVWRSLQENVTVLIKSDLFESKEYFKDKLSTTTGGARKRKEHRVVLHRREILLGIQTDLYSMPRRH
jgi:hypothetical protein